jgi:signal transduction histidine kinase
VRVELAPAVLRRRAGDSPTAAAARTAPDAVACRVLDEGCGIAEEDRERVFDPFFTTRAQGEGTGLGLPNALRLAEEQGGALELEPAPMGFRTGFVLRLPAERAEVSSAASAARTR